MYAQNPPSNLWVDPLTSIAYWSSEGSKLISTVYPLRAKPKDKIIFDENEYVVLLDDSIAGTTSDTNYSFGYLEYGQEYTAGVFLSDNNKDSDTIYFTFTSEYLSPPLDLRLINHLEVTWDPPKFLIPEDPNFSQNDTNQRGSQIIQQRYHPNETYYNTNKSILRDSIPANLLGYVIYKFQDSVDYIEHPTTTWPQELSILDPGYYKISISAIYDLTPYGYAGKGESMLCGPVWCHFFWGISLPFYEDWSEGTFEENEWDHASCNNWIISEQEGNPAPSAVFSGSPNLSTYQCTLSSCYFIGGSRLKYNTWLEFDLKLNDIGCDSSETLTIATWDGSQTRYIDQIFNNGSHDYIHKEYVIWSRISEFSNSLLFIAEGENSSNIEGWYIDNIELTQECNPPLQFMPTYNENTGSVQLDWIPPYITGPHFMGYNDGSFENGLASTYGGDGLGQLFRLEDFQINTPFLLKKIRYFNDDYGNPEQKEKILILTGDGGTILSGPYFVENGPVGDWVVIDIEGLVVIADNFMVATININPEGPFIGVDDYSYNQTLFFGKPGEWTELGELGNYHFVGSHEFMAEYMDKKQYYSYSDSVRELPDGYNIFRSTDNSPYEQINSSLVTEDEYLDETLPEFGLMACYYITCVWEDCESGASNTECLFVPNDISTVEDESLNVWPVPANNELFMESDRKINSITIINSQGSVMIQKENIGAKRTRLNIAELTNGLFFIVIEMNDNIKLEKLIIN